MRIGRIGAALLIGFLLLAACGEEDLEFPGSSEATNTPGATSTPAAGATSTPTRTPTP